ncbi:uncharacterized protein BKA78DRAFT_307392 [Phyllosticta capitalensis]|uniref:uncharacterized protein n=1 Tax=Phyllosticta capitalensis TaxID=121624 RepID=UPI00312DABA3
MACEAPHQAFSCPITNTAPPKHLPTAAYLHHHRFNSSFTADAYDQKVVFRCRLASLGCKSGRSALRGPSQP